MLLKLLEREKKIKYSQTKTKITKQDGFALLKMKQNNPLQVIPYFICLNKNLYLAYLFKDKLHKSYVVLPFV